MKTLRRLVNHLRYSVAGMRLIWDRAGTGQPTDRTMDELNTLRHRYGLEPWKR